MTRSQVVRPVVVVPWYRATLTPDEEFALRHLDAYLSRHPRVIVHPESVPIRRAGFESRPLPDRHFVSTTSYSKLLLDRAFYEAFQEFSHVLIHQLDGLVFADRLLEWCERDFDYVGAPWLNDPARPELGLSRVGNGGLSLRRVRCALEVLSESGPLGRFRAGSRALSSHLLPDLARLPVLARLLKRLRIAREAARGAVEYASSYTLNEDRFWSDRAALFHGDYRLPSPREALPFAFEAAPRACYTWTGGVLPFGCHAWTRWDRAFWEPFLIR